MNDNITWYMVPKNILSVEQIQTFDEKAKQLMNPQAKKLHGPDCPDDLYDIINDDKDDCIFIGYSVDINAQYINNSIFSHWHKPAPSETIAQIEYSDLMSYLDDCISKLDAEQPVAKSSLKATDWPTRVCALSELNKTQINTLSNLIDNIHQLVGYEVPIDEHLYAVNRNAIGYFIPNETRLLNMMQGVLEEIGMVCGYWFTQDGTEEHQCEPPPSSYEEVFQQLTDVRDAVMKEKGISQ